MKCSKRAVEHASVYSSVIYGTFSSFLNKIIDSRLQKKSPLGGVSVTLTRPNEWTGLQCKSAKRSITCTCAEQLTATAGLLFPPIWWCSTGQAHPSREVNACGTIYFLRFDLMISTLLTSSGGKVFFPVDFLTLAIRSSRTLPSCPRWDCLRREEVKYNCENVRRV